MELKPLGKTSVMIPEIGLGTWNYSGGVEPLRKGIELGAFHIDTAEGYNTEDIVGEAIKGIRDRVFIATKVSGRHLGYDDVQRAAENSLRRLGIDQIDLYQVHWPNPAFPLKDTMLSMGVLADRGLVKYIGVSNFYVEDLIEAQRLLRNYPIVSNQVLYNLNDREIERDLMPYCEKNGVTIIAYTPLDNGSLSKKNWMLNTRKMKTLEEIAMEVRKTTAQVALNWCTSKPNVVVIPKSNSVARTVENCGASGWRLSDEQVGRLDAAFS